MSVSRRLAVLLLSSAALCSAALASAQDVPAPPTPAASPAREPARDDFEANPADPEFTLINLPTTARLPRHKSAFRVTHRFARPLGQGDFGDLAGDAFAFDGGAQIGLEYRYAVASGTQLGFYRTSDRTIELFLQRDLWQPDVHPLGLALVASLEGLENLHQDRQPRIAVVVSRPLGERATLYAVPTFIANTNIGVGGGAEESADNTLMVGLGVRLRLGASAGLLAEFTPRVSGFQGGPNADDHVTFALEKRVGGHAFQINVSNDLGTTPGQIARGTQGPDGWFIGFNIARKFY